jgi:3D (Asp-Asp-Asp) domain-containing protein
MRAPSVCIVLLGIVLGLVGDAVTQPQRAEVSRLPVKVTAYTQHQHVAASGRRVRRGVVALSPDLEHALGVEFGDRVVLEGVGTFVFEDRTAARWRRRVDIFMESPKAARQFGVKSTYVRAST